MATYRFSFFAVPAWRKSRFVFRTAACWLLLLQSCIQNERNATTDNTTKQEPVLNIPRFNPDSAYQFIADQVAFGPRVPNTAPHSRCAEYLEKKLSAYTPHVHVQQAVVKSYNNVPLNMRNIIARFNPDTHFRVLLMAHWDTRPWADQDSTEPGKPNDGADDGASGVGVLLELARLVSGQPVPFGIDIVLFDAEDYGTRKGEKPADDSYALGAQYWSRNVIPENYDANYGILLDMVGAKNATFLMEGYSLQYAPAIVRKVWDEANKNGFGNYFLYKEGGFISDDHVYPNTILNIPSIDIINLHPGTGTFGEHWHTHKDNMEIIDRNTLYAVGQTLISVLYSEALNLQ